MKYEVSEEFLQEILNYLIARPYAEVHKLVNKIRTVKPVETIKAVAEQTTEEG